MHTPSTLTSAVADQIVSDRHAAARAARATRRPSAPRFRLRARRSGAPTPTTLVPRGRPFPPFAH